MNGANRVLTGGGGTTSVTTRAARGLSATCPAPGSYWATGDDLGTTTELSDLVLGELGVEACTAIGDEEQRGVVA